MTIQRVVPDVGTDDLEASRTFYTSVLGFVAVMDLGWIVTLASPDVPMAQLSLLTGDATAAATPGVSIEVADVDAVHDRAQAVGADIVHPLTDEPWGVRRFFVRDPSGVVVNVMQHR
jgi:catechol 2,3-dioxygenase-like lactoylglutathione lyase family enzyme